MKPSWSACLDPGSHDRCPDKRRGEKVTHRRDHLRTEAETGVMRPQAKDAWGHGC